MTPKPVRAAIMASGSFFRAPLGVALRCFHSAAQVHFWVFPGPNVLGLWPRSADLHQALLCGASHEGATQRQFGASAAH